MERIYSRPRIHIPKNLGNPKRNGKKIKFSMILIIAVMFFYFVYSSVTPVFNQLCVDKVRSIATMVSNNEATNVMKDYEYEDLVTIYRDNQNKITMIKTNIIPINKIISDVPVKIQEEINKIDGETIQLKLGSFFGNRLLAGMGPNIPIQVTCVGNVETNVRSELIEAGVNQTLHRLYLDIMCNISIVSPYNCVEEKIANQVVLAENIIVGEVPSAYYHLQGIDQSNALDIVE